MAKIAFCSDLHINREIIRLTECLNFLDYIGKYCKDNDITHLVIGGDLFDTSNSIRNQMFIPFFNKLYELKDKTNIFCYNNYGDDNNENSNRYRS